VLNEESRTADKRWSSELVASLASSLQLITLKHCESYEVRKALRLGMIIGKSSHVAEGCSSDGPLRALK
jgi:hypothetical protein